MPDSDFYQLLALSCNDKNLQLLRNCLVGGKDPNCHISLYDPLMCPYVAFGNTILQAAINSTENNLGAIKELINAGADVNLANSAGYTPLHFAAGRRKRDVFDLLLRSGAHQTLNARNFYGQTALAIAIFNFQESSPPDLGIIRKLLQYEDINVNTVDHGLTSPLLLAIELNDLEVVELLLSKGADPNIGKDVYGRSCLHAALNRPLPDYYIVRQLLMNGADLYSFDLFRCTPLDIIIGRFKEIRCFRFVWMCLKIVVLFSHVRGRFMLKIQTFPKLLQYVNRCREEVERMKRDKITEHFTLHHFVLHPFDKTQFVDPLYQIYLPVVEMLVHGFYLEYFYDIFDLISDHHLCRISEIIVRQRNVEKDPGEVNYLEFFFKMDTYGICKFLSRLDRFFLIVAFSNVRISENMQHLRRRGLGLNPPILE